MSADLSRRRCLLLALGACALIPPARAAAPAGLVPAGEGLADLMPAFWRAYDSSSGAAPAQRAAQLVQAFFTPHAAAYRRAGFRHAPDEQAIAGWLPAFDTMAEAVRRLHERFARDHGAQLQRFCAAFPDFDPAASQVTLLPSLFRFDAHLEPDGRSLPLFFGLDGIVRYHGEAADLGVLFAHEVFHCYQAQRNPALSLDPEAPVYAGLWIEGVATFASERLNPQASLKHVLLDDEALWRDGPAALPRVVAALRERLDSTDPRDLSAFFSAGWKGDWPARSGYYAGLLAARRIGGTLPLAAMAALPAAEVRRRLAEALQTLAA